MIDLKFSVYWHYVFDLIAFSCSTYVFRKTLNLNMGIHKELERSGYWVQLIVGAFVGAYAFGTFNLSLQHPFLVGHSVAGALFGGIFSTEIYKWLKGVRGSTGSLFVPSLALGIAIGRLGCFFSGLVDHTYGIATNLPWAINFGDSIFRHPVQLYESLSMFIFFWIYVALRKQKPFLASQIGFYLFIMYYASQRFLWEFYKPYARVWGKMNLFHLVCLGLIFYAALCIFYRRHYARHASSAN